MEFNDGFPPYEVMAQHSEEEGKTTRKALWRVFWIMLGITIFELILGFQAASWGVSKEILKWTFIILTLIKAAYIVLSFMHLGHEKKVFRYTILVPYAVFIVYLIFIGLTEGVYTKEVKLDIDARNATHAYDNAHHGGGNTESHEEGAADSEHH